MQNNYNEDFSKIKREELEKSMIIYFFLTVGMPNSLAIELIEEIETKYNGDYGSTEAWAFVSNKILDENIINKRPKECILNLYPDCLSEKMNKNDPRYKYLDKHTIGQLPNYAFPTKFEAVHGID